MAGNYLPKRRLKRPVFPESEALLGELSRNSFLGRSENFRGWNFGGRSSHSSTGLGSSSQGAPSTAACGLVMKSRRAVSSPARRHSLHSNYMLNRGYAYATIISSKYHGQTLLSHLASLYPHSLLSGYKSNRIN
jgi:hypothetical protein